VDLYLDDCADSNRLVVLLEQAGHLVHTPRSENTVGIDDPDHLVYAAAHGYALIIKNPKDFRALHHDWQSQGRSHAGILLICEDNIRGKDMEPANVTRAIRNLLASGVPIVGELHVLNHWQ
jgi:hypothetical protein